MSVEKKLEKQTEFQNHCKSCIKCQSVKINDTKTLVNACLIGAPLLRDDLSKDASKQQRNINRSLKIAFEDTTRVSEKKLKKLMRYVGQEVVI